MWAGLARAAAIERHHEKDRGALVPFDRAACYGRGDDARGCGPGRRFQATFLRADEVYDHIPHWIKVVGEVFR